MRYPLIVCLVLCLCLITTSGLRSQECDCADINCEGGANLADAYYLQDYLFGGGPAPLHDDLSVVDADGHETLTIMDVIRIVRYVFAEPPPECPPHHPALDPEVDSAITLYYTSLIPAGAGSKTIHLTLDATSSEHWGWSFPLKMRVDGGIPTIDSVIISPEYSVMFFCDWTIYPDSGCLAIGVTLWEVAQAVERIATIYITVPENPDMQLVTMEWVNLPPVQAPVPDSTVIPMMATINTAVEPLLVGHCCSNPGDANEDGNVDVGDAVYLINCIFLDCLTPLCWSHHDANCDGVGNLGDVVYLINYIFRAGPAPCCL
jgi:hypothetical protein